MTFDEDENNIFFMKMGVLGYIKKDDRVLMLYRNKKKKDMHEGLWVAPGGHIEWNESPYEALVREIKEETGLEVHKARLKILLTFPEDGESPFGDLWYGYIFEIIEFSGNIIECDEGELQWIPFKNLLELNMWEGDKIFTPLIFKEEIFDIVLKYKKGKLISHKIHSI